MEKNNRRVTINPKIYDCDILLLLLGYFNSTNNEAKHTVWVNLLCYIWGIGYN